MSPLAEQLRGDTRLSHDLDDAYELIAREDDGVLGIPDWIMSYPEEGM